MNHPLHSQTILLFMGIALVAPASSWADPPQINSISPLGARRGSATEVTVSGGSLSGKPVLIAPFAFTVESPTPDSSDAANWKFKLTVAESVAVGVYPIRIKTDDGISNPFLFSVGQTPQVAEKEENSTFETAQLIPMPVVVEGQAAGNDVDFFRFPGKKGQRIVVDAQCARIGSGVDPTIRLTTAARSFVASADDSSGLLTDARLTAVLPEDTDYVIEISDSRYQGGGRPVYRLLVGPLPVADEIFPLGGRRGETVGFEFRGGTLTDLRTAASTLTAPSDRSTFRLQVTNQNLGIAAPSDPVLELETATPLALGELVEVREPADPSAPPVKVASPVALNGRIDPAGDEDRFVIAVVPGQALRIRVLAADLGSALDGQLQILGANNAVLATADDTSTPSTTPNTPPLISPDPSLNFTPAAGVNEITLSLRDLEGRGGTGFPYRITVEPGVPGSFQVSLNDSQISVPKGGTSAIGVTVQRQGYGGPITLSVANPPAGLTFRSGTIIDGQGVGSLTVSASADAAFGPIELRVMGEGAGPTGPIVRSATKTVVFAQQATLPTNVLTLNGLAASTASPAEVVLDAPAAPIEIVHGYGAQVPVKVARTQGADAPLAFSSLPLPPGLAVPAATIAEKATEGPVTVNAAPETRLGALTLVLVGKGKFANKDRTFFVPTVALNVVRPASLELAAPAVEVKAGETIEVKGKVARKGPFKEPVTIKVDGLPAGLKADPVMLAPDASDFTIKVVSEASAAAVMANVKVVLAFQINKKDYATPPAPLAVKVTK